MKAAVVHEHGAPLVIEDLPVPEPGPGELLVKVEASGLLEEVFKLHAEGRTRVLYETRQLDQVNDAFGEVERGTAAPRLVFSM
jgi:D-arabinose 1-dehydrogenase-like Zn-dependent alcohol dehydrogenase